MVRGTDRNRSPAFRRREGRALARPRDPVREGPDDSSVDGMRDVDPGRVFPGKPGSTRGPPPKARSGGGSVRALTPFPAVPCGR